MLGVRILARHNPTVLKILLCLKRIVFEFYLLHVLSSLFVRAYFVFCSFTDVVL